MNCEKIEYCKQNLLVQTMLNIRNLSNQLSKKAQDELYEKPFEVDRHVKELRNWILQQPHLLARTGL